MISRTAARWPPSVERDSAADIGGHIEILAAMDGRFAFVEAAFGNDFERKLGLAHFDLLPARARSAHETDHLLRSPPNRERLLRAVADIEKKEHRRAGTATFPMRKVGF